MKFPKAAFLCLVIVTIACFTQAQETPQKEGTATQAAPKSKEEANKDFEARMAKLQKSVIKMQEKEAKVKDPQMKADMDALIAKMKQITNDYNTMKSTAGMSEQQQEQSKKRIRSEMDEARKMHDTMKTKYGDKMGGKEKKENSEEMQQPPSQQETSPKY